MLQLHLSDHQCYCMPKVRLILEVWWYLPGDDTSLSSLSLSTMHSSVGKWKIHTIRDGIYWHNFLVSITFPVFHKYRNTIEYWISPSQLTGVIAWRRYQWELLCWCDSHIESGRCISYKDNCSDNTIIGFFIWLLSTLEQTKCNILIMSFLIFVRK